MAPRTPTDVNYAVLRRYLPRLHEILTIATYVHIYIWPSTSNSWRKAGFEGSLFLVSLNPPLPTPEDPIPKTEEYMLFLLNRCSLNNWHYKLRNPDDIDLESGEICVLRANEPIQHDNGTAANGNGNGSGTEDEVAYGLFIFSESGTSTAEDKEKFLKMTKECATTFQATSASAAVPTPVPQPEPQQQQTQAGRSISVLELFQQREIQQPQEPLQNQHQQPAQQQQGYYPQSSWGYQEMGLGGQQMAPQQLPPQHLAQQQWQQQWQPQPQASYEQPVNTRMGVSGGGGDLLSLFQNAKLHRDSSRQNQGY
ncbi:hypothetical protein DFP73DRAFT_540139 [Morchella snyderi]|nr:hypothetical protein DFP73DRAFT_540139 [Morchella snyderi]